MRVHRSNRLEELVEELSRRLLAAPPAALAPECIVVQSKGMERWLHMELSKRLGVFANGRFPFPRVFIEEVFASLGGVASGDREPLGREALAFAIAEELPGLLDEGTFLPLKRYLAGRDEKLRLFLLAGRVAHAFDQYSVYRPALVRGWEDGKGSDWQAILWRRLTQRLGSRHVGSRAASFFKEWSPLLVQREHLPARVSVFGISSLPPLYLRVLGKLSESIQVDMYCLSPTREYFADLARWRASAAETQPAKAEAFHPLLASWGKVGGEFQMILERELDYTQSDRDLYEEPAGSALLMRLQADILACRRPVRPSEPPPRDSSLVVHSCHSAMREVEVLRDQLLGMLHDDPSLRPSDILVVTPSIDTYAPLVDAVFGVPPSESSYIPYTVADRAQEAANLTAGAFLRLLEVLPGRVKASQVLDLLQLEPIRERFGISSGDLERLASWISESGVRWGVDAEHKGSLGQPASARNTWRFGLDRMLLGYALSDEANGLFCGVLPYPEIEGDAALLLGRFVEFCEQLFEQRSLLGKELRVADWSERLLALLDALLVGEGDPWQVSVVRDAILRVEEAAVQGGYRGVIGLDVVTMLLKEELSESRVVHNFLAGGVTFCAMLPMRSIPFRVLAVLGMNDGEFPRTSHGLSFDKIAEKPQPGDRNLRDEDRYLFLETLLSARESLILTFIGRSVQDNTRLPPSVLVSELLDLMRQGYGASDLVVEHPLSPSSPRYFAPDRDPRLFSFGASEAKGAEGLLRGASPEPPEFAEPLPREHESKVGLDELLLFFTNPARGLIRDRLRVYLTDNHTLVEDVEPIELNALDQYQVGSFLLERRVIGASTEDELRMLEQAGLLPAGTPGRCRYEAVSATARDLFRQGESWLEDQQLAPLTFTIALGEHRVEGALRDLRQGAQVVVQYSRVRAKHQLSMWIRHLALCAAGPSDGPRLSVLVGRSTDPSDDRPSTSVFEALSRAQAQVHLSSLLDLYLAGRTAPLPFFPEASLGYVRALGRYAGKPDSEKKALVQAQKIYGSRPGGGLFLERDDPYVVRSFGGIDPLAEFTAEFRGYALRVFEPMLQRLRSEALS